MSTTFSLTKDVNDFQIQEETTRGTFEDPGSPTEATFVAQTPEQKPFFDLGVFPLRADDAQVEEGFLLHDYRMLHVSIDASVAALDRFVIDGVTYELNGPPVKRTTYQELRLRRLIQ